MRRAVTEAVVAALGGDVTRSSLAAGWDTLMLEGLIVNALEDSVGTFARGFRWSANDGGLAARPPRTGDAFANGGRERYGLDASTRDRFQHWLAQANATETSVFVRAVRVYLDICFTHPFDDGNARSARVALDFVLAREGFLLAATGPVFALSRSASDLHGVHNLANVVARCCTRRS